MLLIFKFGGGGKIRTFEDRSQRVYSPPHLTALVPLRFIVLLGIPPNLKSIQQQGFYKTLLNKCNNDFTLLYANY